MRVIQNLFYSMYVLVPLYSSKILLEYDGFSALAFLEFWSFFIKVGVDSELPRNWGYDTKVKVCLVKLRFSSVMNLYFCLLYAFNKKDLHCEILTDNR